MKILLIISIIAICSSCGKKDGPKYQTFRPNDQTIYLR